MRYQTIRCTCPIYICPRNWIKGKLIGTVWGNGYPTALEKRCITIWLYVMPTQPNNDRGLIFTLAKFIGIDITRVLISQHNTARTTWSSSVTYIGSSGKSMLDHDSFVVTHIWFIRSCGTRYISIDMKIILPKKGFWQGLVSRADYLPWKSVTNFTIEYYLVLEVCVDENT